MLETASSILLLLKFGRSQHLREFREEGLLYMKSLADFSKLESDPVRADEFEGTDAIIQPKHLQELIFDTGTKLGSRKIASPELAGPVRISLNRTASCNVYCMFAITRPVDGELVDKQNFGFGDSFVLVRDTTEFLNRVFSAAKVEGLGIQYGPVEYHDSREYTGDTGPFWKRSEFAYQREFRLVVRPGSSQPRKLRIGSLTDVTSEILPLSEINHRLDFSTRSAREAGLSL